LFNAGRYDESLQVINDAIANTGTEHPVLLVNKMIMLCQRGILSKSDFDTFARTMSKSYYDVRSIKLYTRLTESVVTGKCPDVSVIALRRIFENMLDVPVNADPLSLGYSHVNYFIGFTNVYADEPARAVAAFEESLKSRPGASHAMLMAAHLATRNYFDEALDLSEIALSQLEVERQGILEGARVGKEDIKAFQAVVRKDRDAARGGGPNTRAD
jgi:hypothetical protein